MLFFKFINFPMFKKNRQDLNSVIISKTNYVIPTSDIRFTNIFVVKTKVTLSKKHNVLLPRQSPVPQIYFGTYFGKKRLN